MIDDWVDEIARCSRCDTVKPGGEFYRSKTTLSGLQSWCKQCMCGYIKQRYAEEPEFRERAKREAKRWDTENKERKRERMKVWADENRERVRERENAYRRARPEIGRRNASIRRARKMAAPCVPYTQEQLDQRWAYYGNNCWICGDVATATDHVKPLARGGAEMLANLRPVCQPCNSRKHAKWPFKVTD